jgi:hypothetical protein
VDDLIHDVGSLATFDPHPVQYAKFLFAFLSFLFFFFFFFFFFSPCNRLTGNVDECLKSIARDNTQLLFNRIFSQPALRTPDGVFAELPLRSTVVPREKPLPKEKPKTKWDEFAKIKGIEKRKRSSKEWNEERGEFVPRFGKKSAKNDAMADWLVELPDSAPADFDAFADKRKSKKQAQKKQQAQEESNRARARAKGSRAIAGASSVALLSGGKKLDRSALKVTRSVCCVCGGGVVQFLFFFCFVWPVYDCDSAAAHDAEHGQCRGVCGQEGEAKEQSGHQEGQTAFGRRWKRRKTNSKGSARSGLGKGAIFFFSFFCCVF